jgi:pimeloyl-ACP methyl ester carboxylesterase
MPLLEISGNQFYYEDDNFTDPSVTPETILIQHGNLRSSRFFYHWVPRLSRHFRVIRRDLLGYGRSSDPQPGRAWTVEWMLDDLLAFMDALGLEKVHYVGENAGGVLGAAFAARWPDRLSSLTLMSTPMADPGRTSSQFYGHAKFSDVFDALTIDQFVEATMKQGAGGNLGPDQLDWICAEWKKNRMPSLKAMAEMFPSVDLSTTLPKIPVPTLLLSPTRSKVVPLEEQARMCAMIPDARMVEIEGWSISWEQPEACLDALTGFLGSLMPTPAKPTAA